MNFGHDEQKPQYTQKVPRTPQITRGLNTKGNILLNNFNDNPLPRISSKRNKKETGGVESVFLKGLIPKKDKRKQPQEIEPHFAVDDLNDSRPSEHTSGTAESVSSKKSGSGWRKKIVDKMKGYTKKQQTQTNTGTTAAKTSSQGEETKKDDEELNVQLVTDIDIDVQKQHNNYNSNFKDYESQSEEELEDVQSFVDGGSKGSKSKKSSGDSKGSKTIASKVSSKEERKLSYPPIITQSSFIIEDYVTDKFFSKRTMVRRESHSIYSGLSGTFVSKTLNE